MMNIMMKPIHTILMNRQTSDLLNISENFILHKPPVRIDDLLGEQLLTDVKALSKIALVWASLSRFGVLIAGFPKAPIYIKPCYLLF